MNSKQWWFYYFWQLPYYAMSKRYTLPDLQMLELIPHLQHNIQYLRTVLGENFTSIPDEEIIYRSQWVRLQRESDTFVAPFLSAQNITTYFEIEGLEYLAEAKSSQRPIVLLSAHTGSLYLSCIALGLLGYPIFPVARSVEYSHNVPKATSLYLSLNYYLTATRLNGGNYLFTNFSGRLSKQIFDVFLHKKTCFNALDIPTHLYEGKRQMVTFLGQQCYLPIGFIQWAFRKNAIFLTLWQSIENDNQKVTRHLIIDKPLEGDSPALLQHYADRLTAFISQEPWQWMGLPIASRFHDLSSHKVK